MWHEGLLQPPSVGAHLCGVPEAMNARHYPTCVCVCCGETGKHSARGLRWTCYMRHRRAGTLGQFDLIGRLAARRKLPVGPDEVVIPIAVLGVLLAGASSEVEEWAEAQLGSDLVTFAVNAAVAPTNSKGPRS